MNLVALPIIVCLATAVVTLCSPVRWHRRLAVLGTGVQLLAGLALLAAVLRDGMLVLHVGGWAAPLGISLAADLLAAVLVVLTGLLGLVVTLQTAGQMPDAERRLGGYVLLQVLLAGVNAAFLAADLFHLYVAFEIVLIASFALLGLGAGRARRAGTVTYLFPNLLASTLLLVGVGLLYGVTGTLNMADVSVRVAEAGPSAAVTAAAGLLALAFALKAAAFPLHAWLPSAYAVAPPALAALFAGLLTKVGVYALLRLFTLLVPAEVTWLGPALLAAAAATMLVGVLGALGQWEMQKLLSFHVVSQVGYLLVGVALGTPLALAATVYYLFHNSVAKCGLLLATGVVRSRRRTDRLKELGGLAHTDPLLAVLFLLSALALAGLPPLSGFWAKLMVFRAGLDADAVVVVTVAAVVSLLTLLSMAKVWIHAFWRRAPEAAPGPTPLGRLLPLALLATVSVALGLAAGPALDVAERAASQMLDPALYIDTVLGREL